jgi:dihydrodipicolinate synthase/N-acetylneuraminate lyase
MTLALALVRGVSPVLPTPFAADGSLDRRSFARNVAHTWGLGVGAAGVQPGGGFVDIYTEFQRDWECGDRARALGLHRRLHRHLARWWPRHGGTLVMGKAIAWRRGLIASPHCRAPNVGVGDAGLAEADRFIAEFGLSGHR